MDDKRFHAACAAMTGLLSYSRLNPMVGNYHENCSKADCAKVAVEYADALLASLAPEERSDGGYWQGEVDVPAMAKELAAVREERDRLAEQVKQTRQFLLDGSHDGELESSCRYCKLFNMLSAPE